MSHRITMLLVGLPALVLWAASCSDRPATTASDEISAPALAQAEVGGRNGVSTGAAPRLATAGFINFDPPCFFIETLPLQDAPYMNPATLATFIRGHGAVLSSRPGCGDFGVTGYSLPNFVGYNCNGVNSDGTVPALPAEWNYQDLARVVSVRVGSSTNQGSLVTLRAFNVAGAQIGSASTTLTPAMKTLTVNAGSRRIKFVRLIGPCVVVLDDIRTTR